MTTERMMQQRIAELERIQGELEELNSETEMDRNRVHAKMCRAEAEVERLRAELSVIKQHWIAGVGQLDNPWRRRMAELLGDDND